MRLIRLLLVEDGAVVVRAAGNILWEAEPDLLLNIVVNDQHCLAHLKNNIVDLVVVSAASLETPLGSFLQQIQSVCPSARVVFLHTWTPNAANTDANRLLAYKAVARRLAESRASGRSASEAFARFAYSTGGQLILSDLVYTDLAQSLRQLMQETNAAAIYLTDSNARVLSCSETSLKISSEKMSQLLEHSLSRIYETGQLPGHGLESMHLAYRDVDKKNLYLFKVSGQLLLFLLVESGGTDKYFEAVWDSSFQAIAQLRHLLNGGFGKTAPFAGVDERVSQGSQKYSSPSGLAKPEQGEKTNRLQESSFNSDHDTRIAAS